MHSIGSNARQGLLQAGRGKTQLGRAVQGTSGQAELT